MKFAVMARNQMKLKTKTGRGLFHDSLHCIYLPFVDFLFTADNHFIALRDLKIFDYYERIKSIKDDVKLTEKLTKIR